MCIRDSNKGDSEFIPKIKLSENTEKVTNPGNKTIYRIYDGKSGKIRADLICLADEVFDESKDMILFDPISTWKKTKLKGGTYTLRELLVPVFLRGGCVYNSPSVMAVSYTHLNIFFNFVGTVQQTVFCMYMQMCKTHSSSFFTNTFSHCLSEISCRTSSVVQISRISALSNWDISLRIPDFV